MPATPSSPAVAAELMQLLRHMSRTAENVGERLPEEARRIHYGETEARDIRGQASEVKAGSALGVLNAPGDLVGTASATAAAILLTWSNRDPYESLEILRQGPDEHRLRRTTVLDGAFDSHHDTGLSSGLWRYQLRALGHSRKSESVIIEVQLP